MKTLFTTSALALVLAAPVAAQTATEDFVADLLDGRGYPAETIDMLSDTQVASIYITATSESASDVDQLLDGYELPSDDTETVFYDSDRPDDMDLQVRNILAQNGYDEDAILLLSSGEIVSIWTAATSEGSEEVDEALTSAFEAGTNQPGVMSDAEEQVVTYLSREGYEMDEIMDLSGNELLSIYAALSSGNTQDIDFAVESAFTS